MKLIKKTLLCFFLCLCFSFQSKAQQVDYEEIKTALIFQFPEYVEWQKEKKFKTFTIGVYGNDKTTLKNLRELAKRNKIKNLKVHVVSIPTVATIKDVNLLYIGKNYCDQMEQIGRKTEGLEVLLVSEQCKKKKHIMINILYDSDAKKISFEMHKTNIIIEELQIKPELLLLGGTEIDFKELYRDMKFSLVDEQQKVEEQLKLLEEQKAKIEAQQQELKQQSQEFEALNKNIALFQDSINQKEEKYTVLNDNIIIKETILKEKTKELEFQKSQLNRQHKQVSQQIQRIQEQEKRIDSNQKQLISLEQESQKQRNTIAKQQKTLNKKEAQLKEKERSLYSTLAIAIVLLLIGLVIFRAYRVKKASNKYLEERVAIRTSELSNVNINLKNEINEKVLIQKKLIDSEKNYKEIFNASSDSMIILDIKTGKILASNKTFETTFGYSTKKEKGLLITEIIDDKTAKNRPAFLKLVKNSLEKEGKVFEWRTKKKNNNLFWTEVAFSYTKIDDEKKVLAVMRDISERKKVELELLNYRDNLEELVKNRTLQLEKSKDLAESANTAKSQFLSNMSHELRTPLNAILGYSQLLKVDSNMTTKQLNELDTIYSSGAHLLSLINEILDFGKIEAGKMEIKKSEFNLIELIKNVVNVIKVKADQKDLYINFLPADNLPKRVSSDEQKIRQILFNILSNAVKYNDEGGVIFKIFKRKEFIVFEISDTGIGIPLDKQKVIYEPFIQISRTKKFVEGTGLGLPITKKLITLLSGTIHLKSEESKGSTFTIEIPFDEIVNQEIDEKTVETTITGFKGTKKNILIVDDNSSNLSLLSDLLTPLGFSITLAGGGEKGIELIKKNKSDLVLLDFLMPDKNGIEVLKEIKKDKNLQAIKFIGLSANPELKDEDEQFDLLTDSFLSKPIDIKLLMSEIKKHLQIEWIEKERGTKQTDQQELIFPKKAVINELKEAAFLGDFSSIEQIITKINNSGDIYQPFCDKVESYSKQYKSDEIISFIEKNIN